MPTGPPDSGSNVEPVADRIIREAIASGDFDDLPGTGKPIPGAGKVDDELWWVRSWLERNRHHDAQGPVSRE